MSYVITAVISLVLGFIAGLLVGKKNPSVANTADAMVKSAEQLAAKK